MKIIGYPHKYPPWKYLYVTIQLEWGETEELLMHYRDVGIVVSFRRSNIQFHTVWDNDKKMYVKFPYYIVRTKNNKRFLNAEKARKRMLKGMRDEKEQNTD